MLHSIDSNFCEQLNKSVFTNKVSRRHSELFALSHAALILLICSNSFKSLDCSCHFVVSSMSTAFGDAVSLPAACNPMIFAPPAALDCLFYESGN